MVRSALLPLLAFLLVGGLPLQAESATVDKLRASKSITLGYREAALPFSYVDEQGKPIGYAIDLCLRAIGLMKAKLALPDLAIKWQPVTSANRIPLVTKGSVDLECGSTSNTAERQKRVAFSPTYFVSRIAVAVSAKSPITSLAQADGQPVTTATGTTSAIAIKRYEESKRVDFKDFFLRDHQQAFDSLAAGRAVAVVLDDILLAGFIATSSTPETYRILNESLGAEGYGAMLRNDDPAFKALVTETFAELMQSGEAEKLYEKWFTRPIPPKGVNFNLPLSPELKALFQRPSTEPL